MNKKAVTSRIAKDSIEMIIFIKFLVRSMSRPVIKYKFQIVRLLAGLKT